jgi:hypothetical protein
LEETSLNYSERSSEVRNATIMVVLAGVFAIYLGSQAYLLALVIPDSFLMITATIMMVFGLLSFCASLAVWQQKSWAIKLIVGIGVTICVILVLSGIYLMIIIFAPSYWYAINQLRKVA